MDPDLVITICFVGLVAVFGLAFGIFVAHEARQSHAPTATERSGRQTRHG